MIQHMMKTGRGLMMAALCMVAAQSAMAKDALPKDVPGSADPAIVKRFTGSTLIGYRTEGWDAVVFPASAAIDPSGDHGFKNLVTIEGAMTRAVYLSPEGKSPLEVYRNYEQALNAAGLKKKFSCETKCSDQYFALSSGGMDVRKGMKWSDGDIPNDKNGSYRVDSAMSFEDGRMLVGTITQGGVEKWVLLYVSKAVGDYTRYSQAFIQIAEPKAMQTGQVSVLNASDIQAGLTREGKVAFYGLYFDTGKADIKPDSQAQLQEIGKVLKSQPALQVFVVGHTDGQGQLDANLQLSQQRAQAVVNALVKQQGIDAKRLAAKGVASLAPLATNATDEGRARNRRVELVVR
jgi:OOP family OmpA-OmpF porin